MNTKDDVAAPDVKTDLDEELVKLRAAFMASGVPRTAAIENSMNRLG